ncbi:hypothetical protein J7T60_08750 [Streptococcus thermophilus]|nr:hypothetical protein [Streptococcus thermophilus]MCE2173662.1 hypothetical protein [Streptococcus thermophilus]MCE2176940.1 hypothetical protein [Streptococcus thermophilus]MCE2178631.1 hypothetical protein [Streptococcus thermophilus]MCE2180280.1 hypothetical protein [Streptococcus thermophilus]
MGEKKRKLGFYDYLEYVSKHSKTFGAILCFGAYLLKEHIANEKENKNKK